MRPLCPRHLLLLALSLLAASSTAAQTARTISGRVLDAETGEALPSANLLIEGARSGTVTNVDGRFELALPTLPATVLVRYLGYESASIAVTSLSPASVDVTLRPVRYELGELIVTGEDPAIAIMRQVIERKQERDEQLRTWQAKAYTRFTISNDTGIVGITESVTRAYWDRDRGLREVAESKRQTANIDLDDYIPAASAIINFYADDIEIGGFRAIGPTHPDALHHYDFHLADRGFMDERLVYIIDVKPAGRLQPAFVGTIAVLDGVFALLQVDLRPSEAIRYPPPLSGLEQTFHQQFSDFGQAFWLPVDFRQELVLPLRLPGLRFPTLHFQQTSRLTDYQINVPLPDSLFDSDERLTVDSVAVAAAGIAEDEGTVVPLSDEEEAVYARADSAVSFVVAFKPSGPLARFIKMRTDTDSSGGSLSIEAGSAGGGAFRMEPQVWFNRVEALHAGLQVSLPLGPFALSGTGAYRTGENAWSYGISAALNGGNGRSVRVGYRYGTEPRYSSDFYPRWLNGLTAALGIADYFDYYHNEAFVAELSSKSITLGLHLEEHSSARARTGYDLFASDATFRPNPALPEEGAMRELSASWNAKSDRPGGGVVQSVGLGIDHGAGWLGSDFAFTRLNGSLALRLPTFLRRRLLPNTLNVRLAGGTSFGNLPPQRSLIVEGALAGFSPLGTLHARQGRPYEGEHVAALFWEQNFRTVPFEVIGLRPLADRGWSISLNGAHARTWFSDEARDRWGFAPGVTPKAGHHEIGASLHVLSGFLRLGPTVRLNDGELFFSAGFSRVF